MDFRRTAACIAVALTCVFAGFMAGEPNNGTGQKNAYAADESAATLASHGEQETANATNTTDNNPPHWYAALKRPEWWQVILAVIGIAVIAWQVWETRRAVEASQISARAAQDTAVIAGKQFETTQRPWIYVEVGVLSGLTVNQVGVHINLGLTLHNCGSSPATGVRITPKLYKLSPTNLHPMEERKRICEELVKSGHCSGETIFPNRVLKRNYVLNVPAEEFTTFLPGGYYALALIICVGYRAMFKEDSRYYVGSLYDIVRIDQTSRLGIAFTVNEEVPSGQVQAVPYPIYGEITQ